MIVFLIFSIVYIMMFLLYAFINMIKEINIPTIYFKVFFFLFIISCCIVAFYSTDFSTDSSGWDLNRYYIDINNLRGHSIKYAFKNCMYKESYVTTLLFYFVSLLSNNCWLQVISTFISLIVLMKILLYQRIENGHSYKAIFSYFILFFSIIFASFVLLSVRWIMAISLCSYASLISDNKKNVIKSIIVYLIAFFIHYGIALFIIAKLCSLFKNKIVQLAVPISFIIVILFGSIIFKDTELFFIVEKLDVYNNISADDIRVYVIYIVLAVLFSLLELTYYNKLKIDSSLNKNILLASICGIFNYHLFTRMIGIYYYHSSHQVMEVFEQKNTLIYKIFFYIIICGMYAYQVVFIYNYWRFSI